MSDKPPAPPHDFTIKERQDYESLVDNLLPVPKRLTSKNCASTVTHILELLDAYVIGNDGSQWKRALLVGFARLDHNTIAVSMRELGCMIPKCKSVVNSSLHHLGYSTVQHSPDNLSALLAIIPCLRYNSAAQRSWTIWRNVSRPVLSVPVPRLRFPSLNPDAEWLGGSREDIMAAEFS
jgi:hypothetical protein